MIVMVCGATAAVRRFAGHPHLGWLQTPVSGNAIAGIMAAGCVWGADNDCFVRLNKPSYIRMLRRISGAPTLANLRFVAVPDVPYDAARTLARWAIWRPVLGYFGLPAAFVAQDGQEHLPLPWDAMDAIFIGGSTAWKEGPPALRLMREARERGKWVHVGRVNTMRRKLLLDAVGVVDSFDGTCFSRLPDKFLPGMLRALAYRQHGMDQVFLCS